MMGLRRLSLLFVCIALCGSVGALEVGGRNTLFIRSHSSKATPKKVKKAVEKAVSVADPIAKMIPDETKWMVMQAKEKFVIVSKILREGGSLWEAADDFMQNGKVYAVLSVLTGGIQIGCKIAAGILTGGVAGPLCGVLGSAFGAVAELFKDTRHSDLAEIKKDIQQLSQSMSKVAGRISSYQSVVGALVENEGIDKLQPGTRGALDELITAVLDGRAAAMEFGRLNKTMDADLISKAKEDASRLVASISSRIEHWDEKVFFHVFNVEATHLGIRTNGIVGGIRAKVDELSEQHQYTAHQLNSIIGSLERQDKVMDAVRAQNEVMNGKLDEIKDLLLHSEIECKMMMVKTFAKESHMIADSFKRNYCTMACRQSLQRVTFSGAQNILHMMLLFQRELDLIEGGFDTNGIEVPPDVCDVPAKDRVDLPGGVFFLHAVNTFPRLYNGLDLKRDSPLNIALELPEELNSDFLSALTPLVTLDGLQRPNVDFDNSLHIAIMSEDVTRVDIVLDRLRRNNERARKHNRRDTVLEAVITRHNRLNQSPITLAASIGGDIEQSLQQLLSDYPGKFEELKNAPTPAELPHTRVTSISTGFRVEVSIDETKLHRPDYRAFRLVVEAVDSLLEIGDDDNPSIQKDNGPKLVKTVVVPLNPAGYGDHTMMVEMESEAQRRARVSGGDTSTDGDGDGAMTNNHVYDFTVTLCRSTDCTDDLGDEISDSVTDLYHDSLEDLAASPHKAASRGLEGITDATQKARWLTHATEAIKKGCRRSYSKCLSTGGSFTPALTTVLTQLEQEAVAGAEVDDTIAAPLVEFVAWMHVALLRNIRISVKDIPCSGSPSCSGLLLDYVESVAIDSMMEVTFQIAHKGESNVAETNVVCAAVVVAADLFFANGDLPSTSEHSERVSDHVMRLIGSNSCYESKRNQMGWEVRHRRSLVRQKLPGNRVAEFDQSQLGANFGMIVRKLLEHLEPVTCDVTADLSSQGAYRAYDLLNHEFDPIEYKMKSNTPVRWAVDNNPVDTNMEGGVEEVIIRFPCLALKASERVWSVSATRSGWFERWIGAEDSRHHCSAVLDLDETTHMGRYRNALSLFSGRFVQRDLKHHVTNRPLEVDHAEWWTKSSSAWKVVVPLGRVFPGAVVSAKFNGGSKYDNHWVIGRLYLYAADTISIAGKDEDNTWTIVKSSYVLEEGKAPSLKTYEVLPRAAAKKYSNWSGSSIGLDDINLDQHQEVEGLFVIGDQNSISENMALKEDKFEVEVKYPNDFCKNWEVVGAL